MAVADGRERPVLRSAQKNLRRRSNTSIPDEMGKGGYRTVMIDEVLQNDVRFHSFLLMGLKGGKARKSN